MVFRKLISKFSIFPQSRNTSGGRSRFYPYVLMIALGVFFCGLTTAEALKAATLNAARAINRGSETGSLEPGKKADIIILDVESPGELPYYFGTNLVTKTIKDGVVIPETGWPEPAIRG